MLASIDNLFHFNELTHLVRVLIWFIVFAYAYHYRNIHIGILAILGGLANGLIAGGNGEDWANNAATIIFMLTLPGIAYELIDKMRQDALRKVKDQRYEELRRTAPPTLTVVTAEETTAISKGEQYHATA